MPTLEPFSFFKIAMGTVARLFWDRIVKKRNMCSMTNLGICLILIASRLKLGKFSSLWRKPETWILIFGIQCNGDLNTGYQSPPSLFS